VRAIFTAVHENDEALFYAVIAPDFYLFEAGVRFDGPGMLALIKAERDAGKSFEWDVTEPDIRIGGNVAWIAYVNPGSITDAAGTKPQVWLESAFLREAGGTLVDRLPAQHSRAGLERYPTGAVLPSVGSTRRNTGVAALPSPGGLCPPASR
jgi:hypothetical protein